MTRIHAASTTSAAAAAVAALFLLLGSSPSDAFRVIQVPNANAPDKFVIGTAALPRQANPELLLDGAIERGFNTFDLARTYGGGESEKIFGKWLQKHGGDGGDVRRNLHIITKGGMGEDKYGDPDRPILTFEGLQSELDSSLQSLQTEAVDMYMLHRDDPRLSTEMTVDWMNKLVDQGKIKAWGVSNWSLERTKAAIDYAHEHNLVPPTANSPHFSLAVPKVPVWPTTVSLAGPDELTSIEQFKECGVDLYCWEVLAKGFMAVPDLWTEPTVDKSLVNRPEKEVELGTDQWRQFRIQRAYCTKENYVRRIMAKELATKHGLSLAQISTLYALSRGDHVHVLIGADRVEHLDEMIALRDLRLCPEAMDQLTFLVDPYWGRPTGPRSRERAAEAFLERLNALEEDLPGVKDRQDLAFAVF